jgi:hypothetical protein
LKSGQFGALHGQLYLIDTDIDVAAFIVTTRACLACALL